MVRSIFLLVLTTVQIMQGMLNGKPLLPYDETRWQNNEILVFHSVNDTLPSDKCYMRKRLTYTPVLLNPANDRGAWFVIHGTWGQETPSFYANGNAVFEAMKRAVALYASQENKTVELLSYRWDGDNNDKSRYDAGNVLKRYIRGISHYKKMGDINFLSHSHGCNVANFATNGINGKSDFPAIEANNLIHYGCGVRKEYSDERKQLYQPEHFKRMLYFYSLEDIFAQGARVIDLKYTAAGITAIGGVLAGLFFAPGATISSSGLFGMGFAMLMERLRNDLEVFGYGDHHMNRRDGKEVAGVEMKFFADQETSKKQLEEYKSFKARWSQARVPQVAIHSKLVEAVYFLPEILQTLKNQYPEHYRLSGRKEDTNFALSVIKTKDGSHAYLTLNQKKKKGDNNSPEVEEYDPCQPICYFYPDQAALLEHTISNNMTRFREIAEEADGISEISF